MSGVNLEILRSLREKAGLTQEDVSKTLGYQTLQGYHYLESGRCRLRADQAILLGKLYGVPMEIFFASEITVAVMNEADSRLAVPQISEENAVG